MPLIRAESLMENSNFSESQEGYKVFLNVYDLSQGLAQQLTSSLLGRAIEGIWYSKYQNAMLKMYFLNESLFLKKGIHFALVYIDV